MVVAAASSTSAGHQLVLHSPVTAFADDLHLKVVDPAGGWNGVGGPHRGCIFGGFSVTYRWEDKNVYSHGRRKDLGAFPGGPIKVQELVLTTAAAEAGFLGRKPPL